MPKLNRMPSFSVGDQVTISVVHLPKDSKFSPRLLGPFRVSAIPHPYAYELSFLMEVSTCTP